MTSTAQATKNIITLRGSTEIVTEFFAYSVNSILFQRGIYPPNTFSQTSKYGLTMVVTSDEGLKNYLSQVLSQLSEWLLQKHLQKLVLVITSVDTGETIERWVFDIQTDDDSNQPKEYEKPKKEIMTEIQAIIRQITASVTFLPLLEESYTFDLLVYTNADCDVPLTWEESDPRHISNSSEVRLRSFTTKVHKVDAMVSYKMEE